MRRRWIRYGFGGSLSVLAWLLSAHLDPFPVALAAFIATTFVAGTGPAILCLCFSILWISFIAQPAQTVVFTGGGVLLCALSTRMHRALARTAQSERWYRQLAETSAEGIWVLDELGADADGAQQQAGGGGRDDADREAFHRAFFLSFDRVGNVKT